MTKKEYSKIPYDERSDDQKLESNWNKARKQFDRKDWSASILRVATAAEIAANIYIRNFLIVEYGLPASFVDSLMISANGLDGKFNRLIRPVAMHKETWKELSPIHKKIKALHDHRNGVAHSGKFINKKEAKACFRHSILIIQALVPDEARKLNLPFEH